MRRLLVYHAILLVVLPWYASLSAELGPDMGWRQLVRGAPRRRTAYPPSRATGTALLRTAHSPSRTHVSIHRSRREHLASFSHFGATRALRRQCSVELETASGWSHDHPVLFLDQFAPRERQFDTKPCRYTHRVDAAKGDRLPRYLKLAHTMRHPPSEAIRVSFLHHRTDCWPLSPRSAILHGPDV